MWKMKQETTVDIIPEGTFFALDDPEAQRRAVIKWVIEMGEQLAQKHPEIAELYRDTDRLPTCLDIAREYVPAISESYPYAASKMVGHAVRLLIPDEEQAELTKLRRTNSLEDVIGDRFSDEWREICSQASKKRHEIHGVDVEAMIRGRGRIPWRQEERDCFQELMQNPEYQHSKGSIMGTPDYGKIASEINRAFHNSEEVRTSKSLGNYARDLRRQEKKK